MLKEISCSKFMSYGKVRDPIPFHLGLNTVIGSATAKNSIGKTTFLMIIDFAFGGEDYVLLEKDVAANIGPHTICFEMDFDDGPHYFSRSTSLESLERVNVCDSSYNVTKTISLSEYNDFLKKEYRIPYEYLSFRSCVSMFMRIYNRDTLNEKHPMQTFMKEKDSQQIDSLLQIYGKYDEIEELRNKQTELEKKAKTLNDAGKYGYIPKLPTLSEYRANQIQLVELKKQLDTLSRNNDDGLLDLDSEKASSLSSLKSQLSSFRRKRTICEGKIKAIKDDQSFEAHKIETNFEELKQFFPNEDFRSLKEVEDFHFKMRAILNGEYKEALDRLDESLSFIDQQITGLEGQIAEITAAPNLSKPVLMKYSDLEGQIKAISSVNEKFEESQTIKDDQKTNETDIEAKMTSVVSELQKSINGEMEKINDFIYKKTKTPPRIEIKDSKHYSFSTENDTGTGTQYRGLLVFDLSALQLSKVPVAAHDSLFLKQLGDDALQGILASYIKTKELGKQVFIAIDKEDSYPGCKNMLEETRVLFLEQGGNELFGTSWNNKKPAAK
jgi:hypothetical protein